MIKKKILIIIILMQIFMCSFNIMANNIERELFLIEIKDIKIDSVINQIILKNSDNLDLESLIGLEIYQKTDSIFLVNIAIYEKHHFCIIFQNSDFPLNGYYYKNKHLVVLIGNLHDNLVKILSHCEKYKLICPRYKWNENPNSILFYDPKFYSYEYEYYKGNLVELKSMN